MIYLKQYRLAVGGGLVTRGKVLIADDDPNVLELFSLYLQKDDYEVLTALDGEEALQVTREQNRIS